MPLKLLKMKHSSLSKNPPLLADENIPIEFIETLSKEGYDIKRVSLGSKDKQIFELAISEDRVLLTLDKHFLNKLKFPPKESLGIILISINPPLIDSLYFSLSKLFNKIDSSKFKGRLFILSSSGFKVFPRF